MVLFPTQDLDDIHCLLLPHTMHFRPYLYGNGILIGNICHNWCNCKIWMTCIEVTGQLVVATCVRLQLQNMQDESRGMTQTCIARSDERFLRSGRAHVVKVCEFSGQIQMGGTNGNAEEQFVTFSRSWRRLFRKVLGFVNVRHNEAVAQGLANCTSNGEHKV